MLAHEGLINLFNTPSTNIPIDIGGLASLNVESEPVQIISQTSNSHSTLMLDVLPDELWNIVLEFIDPVDLSSTVYELLLAGQNIDPSWLHRHIVLRSNDQLIRFQKAPICRARINCDSFIVQSFDLRPDLLAVVLEKISTPRLTLRMGPTFAPEFLLDILRKPRQIEHLQLIFRPYTPTRSYYQFLKGSYYDSCIEALEGWTIRHLQIIQIPMSRLQIHSEQAEPQDFATYLPYQSFGKNRFKEEDKAKQFAPAICFFGLEHLVKSCFPLKIAPEVMVLRVPRRNVIQHLTFNGRGLDLSHTSVGTQDIIAFLERSWAVSVPGLDWLILDHTNPFNIKQIFNLPTRKRVRTEVAQLAQSVATFGISEAKQIQARLNQVKTQPQVGSVFMAELNLGVFRGKGRSSMGRFKRVQQDANGSQITKDDDDKVYRILPRLPTIQAVSIGYDRIPNAERLAWRQEWETGWKAGCQMLRAHFQNLQEMCPQLRRLLGLVVNSLAHANEPVLLVHETQDANDDARGRVRIDHKTFRPAETKDIEIWLAQMEQLPTPIFTSCPGIKGFPREKALTVEAMDNISQANTPDIVDSTVNSEEEGIDAELDDAMQDLILTSQDATAIVDTFVPGSAWSRASALLD